MKRKISILILSLALIFTLPIVSFGAELDSEDDNETNLTEVVFESDTNGQTSTTIDESESPLVGSLKGVEVAPPTEKWALLNLILALITFILSIVFLFVRQKKRKDDYNEGAYKEDKKDMRRFKLLALFIGIVSIIVFLFTEDITLEMQLIDKWTIIMLLFFIDQLFATFIIYKGARGSKKDEQWRRNE